MTLIKKMSLRLLLATYSLLLLFSYSCTTATNSSQDEGKITYSITYPGINTEEFLINLLPEKMEMYFSNDGFSSEIEAGAGMFKTSLILNKKTDKLTHCLKLLSKKVACDLTENNRSEIATEQNNISFQSTKNTKEIAGYLCKEVIASIPSADSSISFKIYYTDEINLENPNQLTIFEGIKGVLMEYESFNYDVHMKFTAEEVQHIKVDKSKFELESGYKKTSPDILYNEIQELFKMIQ